MITSEPVGPLFDALMEYQRLIIFAAITLAVAVLAMIQARTRAQLPPGPKGYWLVGNTFQMPRDRPWLQFTEWSKTFGEVYCITYCGTPFIILNSAQACFDLLDARSNIYSDRPNWVMASEIMAGGLRTLFMHYSESWRRNRRLLHQQLNQRAAEHWQPIQEHESRIFARDIGRQPHRFYPDHARRFSASTIMRIAYNHRVHDYYDPLVQRVNDSVKKAALAVNPGAYLVDFFPWMMLIPDFLAPWKANGKSWHKEELSLFKDEVKFVNDQKKDGNKRKCFVNYMGDDPVGKSMTVEAQAYAAGSLFGAGSETTSSAIGVVMLVLMSFPNVQRKAQEEVDREVGRERMPTFDDLNHLPYIKALVKETFRWRPVAAGGFAHRSVADDVYKGYRIPKGSIIIPNHWALHRDPVIYSDPEAFKPERFLSADGKTEVNTPLSRETGHHTFGFGRRVCPGQHVATRSVQICTAVLAWTYMLSKPKDEKGVTIEPDLMAFSGGASSGPLPFQCTLTPRTSDALSIVDAELVECEAFWDGQM